MSQQAIGLGSATGAPRAEPRARPSVGASQWVIAGLVAAVAVVNGLLYLLIVPPWQHYDEPTHFEYVWLYAQLERRPAIEDVDLGMRRELAAAMATAGFYDGLTPPDILEDTGEGPWVGLIELPHPPLYYFLTSLPVRLVKDIDLTSQLYVARGVSLLMFVLIVLAAAGLMTELTPRGHPLRWAVPLAVALFPSFANQMTAVNNDVGSVLMVSCFVWGSVRLVRRFTLWRLLALAIVSGLALITKSTAALTVATLPLILILALWRAAGWSWRWFWIGGAVAVLVPLAVILSFDEAAYWYRGWGTLQPVASRATPATAPWGEAALSLLVGERGSNTFISPLTRAQSDPLAGEIVTIGGWMWAEEPTRGYAPSLYVSPDNTTSLDNEHVAIDLTQAPTFFGQEVRVPEDAGRVHYGIVARLRNDGVPTTLYLDGAFLVEGALPLDSPPRIEGNQVIASDGTRHANLLRNPSFEQRGPRVKPWLDELVSRYNRTVTNHIVMSVFDLQRTGPFMGGIVLPTLLSSFVGSFGWGHVLIPAWASLTALAVGAVALLGAVKWVVVQRGRPPNGAALVIVLVLFLVSLASALVWPLPFRFLDQFLLPSGRYLFPATIPIMLIIVGGWWALAPRRWRVGALLLLLLGVLLLDGLALHTIQSYYASAG